MLTQLLSFAIVLSSLGVVPAGIETEVVIGPEFPGQYKHPASFTELANGDLYLAYYGGGGEYEDESKVWGMRKVKGADTWTEPKIIADTPFLGEGNPVVWEAPDGIVWLFFVQRYGDTWSSSRIHCKISRDGAQTWSDSFVLAFEPGMMVRSRPIVLNSGEYLLGIYHETGEDREIVGRRTCSLFLRYDPNTHTWTESERIYSRQGNLQPTAVQITDNYLVMYARRGGGYEPVTDGWLVRAESRDGGHTWTKGKDSKFPNPNAATDFIRLQNGHLMLVYNDSMNERDPLTIAISTDHDKTYPYKVNLGEGDLDFAYPVALQTKDGKIHVIYTANERSTVYHSVFDEQVVLDAGAQ